MGGGVKEEVVFGFCFFVILAFFFYPALLFTPNGTYESHADSGSLFRILVPRRRGYERVRLFAPPFGGIFLRS